MSNTVLSLRSVSVVRDGNAILDAADWTVTADQRWVILGPNGAGKTTLVQLAAAASHPTSGGVTILDEELGKADLAELKPRIGYASSALAKRIPKRETVLDVVLTAAYSVTGRWNEEYEAIDTRRARRVLAEWKLDALADRAFGTLSDGEQKRVQIARAVMTDPELLILDEPAASLDLGAREELVTLLGGYASDSRSPAMIMVTHHAEEIPTGFTHVLLLKNGKIVAAGPLEETLTSERLTETFGLPIEVSSHDGRYTARAKAAAEEA
ncbi:ABC transporter ATP-binding protein [Humibacter sp. RRB41]|uniref:ABC transporter ATP-binding protein n=1 Tax=Humibacter sp. RRB41 TaxID=2919946 RepID=UPI001FA98D8E|nr:ABC transporter ATP-binding protein [Humibacter sp. RRB41]